jgi:hypothetical protein
MMKKYEAPRAVRLSDAETGSGYCYSGSGGTNTPECVNGPTFGTSCGPGTSPM